MSHPKYLTFALGIGAIGGLLAIRWLMRTKEYKVLLVQSPEELGYRLGEIIYEANVYNIRTAMQQVSGNNFAAQVSKNAEGVLSPYLIQAIKGFQHPHLVTMYDIFATRSAVFEIVDNVFAGNDLFDYIYNSRNMHLSEKQAATILEQLLQALKYLHERGFVHRNVRPDDSIFMRQKLESAPEVVLGNYCFLAQGSSTDYIGAPCYVAPEMVRGDCYDSKVDLWALGVTLHTMLTGNLPFDHSDPARLGQLICTEQLQFRGSEWQNISAGAIDLTMALLNKDPDRRCSAARALTHPWIVAKGDLPNPTGGCCKGSGGAAGGCGGGSCGSGAGSRGGGGGCCRGQTH
eukprot:EG_transcript_15054